MKKGLHPQGFRKKYFSLAAILALHSALLAQNQNITLNEKSNEAQENLKLSIVHAQEFEENEDFKEEFTAREIQQSNAQNIYDFLNTHSMLSITTNYGNPYAQNIDLRGFGQNGHKNLAIIVDGMRLDNIDSTPLSLSNIPLDSIQKIEIIRGKGTTKYGNGTVSGILKITTTRKSGGSFNLGYATYDTFNTQFFSRLIGDTLNIGAYGQYQNTEGSRYLESSRDEKSGSSNENGGITAFLYPEKNLLLKSHLNYAKYGIKYANPLSKMQFIADPAQAGNGYTHQKRWDLAYSAGLTYFGDSDITTDINFGGDRNESRYINYHSTYDGKGVFGNFNTQIQRESFMFEIGGEIQDKERTNLNTKAEVETMLLYFNAEKRLKDSILNAGISTQRVLTQQNSMPSYSKANDLIGGELGYHYTINSQTALFASYAHSFIVPNVEWMLRYDPLTFAPVQNTMIETATFDTYQIGAQSLFGIHALEGSLFWIQGHKEAYYGLNKITGFTDNQSLGNTQRIGGEVKLTTHFSAQLYSTLGYTYVDATIKSDNEGYYGKNIPGVSAHTFVASLNFLPIASLNLGIHYKYASGSYDYNDFDNVQEKAPPYQMLNLNLAYTFKDIELYAYIQNLTNHKNAIVVSGAYYPYEFERIFGGGIKYRW